MPANRRTVLPHEPPLTRARPNRVKKAWDACKIDPQQIKGLAYVLVLALLGNVGTESLQKGNVDKKLDDAQKQATSLVESNAATAKAFLQKEVDSLKAFIDGVKANVQGEIAQASATAKSEISQLQANVDSRLQNTPTHSHIFGTWSAPVQMDGNFIQPQFYQTRECKICGEAELKKAQRP